MSRRKFGPGPKSGPGPKFGPGPNSVRALALVLVLALAGCGGLRFGARAEGPYFATRLCGVEIDGAGRNARLRLTLSVLKPLPSGALVETEFHNAAERSTLTAQRTAGGSERELVLVSPPFSDVRVRKYETVTRVYRTQARKELLGVHTYLCESLVDPRSSASVETSRAVPGS